jgi:hypothetical protein
VRRAPALVHVVKTLLLAALEGKGSQHRRLSRRVQRQGRGSGRASEARRPAHRVEG